MSSQNGKPEENGLGLGVTLRQSARFLSATSPKALMQSGFALQGDGRRGEGEGMESRD